MLAIAPGFLRSITHIHDALREIQRLVQHSDGLAKRLVDSLAVRGRFENTLQGVSIYHRLKQVRNGGRHEVLVNLKLLGIGFIARSAYRVAKMVISPFRRIEETFDVWQHMNADMAKSSDRFTAGADAVLVHPVVEILKFAGRHHDRNTLVFKFVCGFLRSCHVRELYTTDYVAQENY